MNEYDSDATGTFAQTIAHPCDVTDGCGHAGRLEAQEFVQLVMSKARSPEEEMRETWKFFDVDQDGVLTTLSLNKAPNYCLSTSHCISPLVTAGRPY